MRTMGLNVYEMTTYQWRCRPCEIESEPVDDFDVCDRDRVRHYQTVHHDKEQA